MPLALGLIAILLIVVAITGNYPALQSQFQTTFFSGSNGTSGFVVWFGSILGIAVLFRIIGAPKAGEAFIGLLLVVYALKNQTFLTNLETALQSAGGSSSSSSSSSAPPQGATTAGSTSSPAPSGGTSTGTGGGS